MHMQDDKDEAEKNEHWAEKFLLQSAAMNRNSMMYQPNRGGRAGDTTSDNKVAARAG